MRKEDVVRKLGGNRLFVAVASRVAPVVDRALYRRLGGRVLGAGPPVLLLTTVGRKTGRQRTVPLLYVEEGEKLAVAASNWGRREHPGWSENLLAEPLAWVQVGEERRRCRARPATPRERELLWGRFLRLWPAYDAYRRRCGREIRIFILENA